ncbi:hypothetical protein FRC02_000094 [Tulasnella sp. 418]|nr:hypothetical protein FRC02_000094 [Tulasnella sp. 418]
MRRINVIGSLNVDLVSTVKRVPQAGETISATGFSTNCGGKGANQAVATSRLAGQTTVSFVGAVGNDEFGRNLRDGINKEGVNVDNVVVREELSSGVAVILVEESGENRIIISAGANAAVTPAAIPGHLFAPNTAPDLIILQLEIPLETVLHVISLASAATPPVPVLFNPAPAVTLPNHIYPLVHTLVVNESEASMLSGISLSVNGDELESKAMEAIGWFIKMGANNIVITLGEHGAVYHDSVLKQSAKIPAKSVNVVDTTSAGDTFVGALAVHIVQNDSFRLSEAVEFAVTGAAWTVQRRGTWDAMPRRSEL